MKLWIDADACPKAIKEVLYRAAERVKFEAIFVANSYLNIPPSPFLQLLQVPDGFDIADNKIVELCNEGDLVITADIPLAARVIEKGAFALNPRGQLYDANNIGPILSTRNFMHSMRSSISEGQDGPAAFTMKDKEMFSNALDKFLTRRKYKPRFRGAFLSSCCFLHLPRFFLHFAVGNFRDFLDVSCGFCVWRAS